MRDTRTNALLAQIMLAEEKLTIADRSNITMYVNGGTIQGKIISDEEYYARPENNKYKDIYYDYIKIPREPFIKHFEETGELQGFPDNLRQVHLHILDLLGKSIQIRLADIVAFSFD